MGGKRRSRARQVAATPPPPVASSTSPNVPLDTQMANLEAKIRQAQAVADIHKDAFASRPKNTRNAYLPRQKEWRAWCEAQAFEQTTLYTVTSDKLAFFLREEVVGREKKKGGRRKKEVVREANSDDEEAPAPGVKQTVSWQTVDAYVAAMVNLWEDQKRAGVNSHAHPRGGAVEEIMGTMRRSVAAKKRIEYHDRGIGTYLDGYNSVEQLQAIALHLLRKNSPEGVRELAMHRLSFGGLLRGHHVREADYADFHTVVLEDMGYSRCIALILVLDHGKTNQSGRLEMAGMIRAKDFLTCPLFAFAAHLFYEFHLANRAYPPDNQSFPSFSQSPDWYDLKAFASPKDLMEPMKYETHRSAVAKTHKKTGIISKTKTHLDRGAASRMADLGGASQDSIRRAGRWDQSSLSNCYLTTLPRESMRALAQFSSTGGDFYLERDIKVPDQLLALVFPQADVWIERQKTGDRCTPNIAANGFLLLLRELRTVLIQDMVQLRKIHPTFFLFNHPLFSSPAFLQYEQHALRTISTKEDPADMRLRQAMPVLADQLKSGFNSVLQASREQASRAEATEKLVGLMGTMLSDIFSGVAPIRLNAEWPRSATGSTSAPTTSTSSASAPPPGSTSATPSAPPPPAAAPSNPLTDLLALTSISSTAASATSSFSMSRTISSVTDLWREYDQGIGGRPAVRDVYEIKGHKWSSNDSERKHYQRRMTIVEKVKQLALQHTVREVDVAERLDEFCRSSHPKVSLSKLQSLIKGGKVNLQF
ncbi:hypothetical protein P7C70_g6078, partial [Phenoliferia sp. Uapishka_3]